jgi:hypothetical protein
VGLSDDQKAMLRLLAQREEGYEDMAALMGISAEEVRERVKEALAEVDTPPAAQEPASAPVEEPSEPAASPPPPTPEPESSPNPEPAAPAAAQPVAEEPAKPVSRPPAPKPKRQAQPPGLKLPKDRGALIGVAAGVLVFVALAIVLAVSGGGDGSDSGTTAGDDSDNGTLAAAENPNLTQAVLSSVDGGDANGTALFGRFKQKVLLQVTASDLEPSGEGESYAVWLSHGGKAMVPVGTAPVSDSGELAARFEIPAAVLVLVARSAFDQVDVTRTSDALLNTAIAKARRTKTESAYTGTDVLRGEITGPLIGAGGDGKGQR